MFLKLKIIIMNIIFAASAFLTWIIYSWNSRKSTLHAASVLEDIQRDLTTTLNESELTNAALNAGDPLSLGRDNLSIGYLESGPIFKNPSLYGKKGITFLLFYSLWKQPRLFLRLCQSLLNKEYNVSRLGFAFDIIPSSTERSYFELSSTTRSSISIYNTETIVIPTYYVPTNERSFVQNFMVQALIRSADIVSLLKSVDFMQYSVSRVDSVVSKLFSSSQDLTLFDKMVEHEGKTYEEFISLFLPLVGEVSFTPRSQLVSDLGISSSVDQNMRYRVQFAMGDVSQSSSLREIIHLLSAKVIEEPDEEFSSESDIGAISSSGSFTPLRVPYAGSSFGTDDPLTGDDFLRPEEREEAIRLAEWPRYRGSGVPYSRLSSDLPTHTFSSFRTASTLEWDRKVADAQSFYNQLVDLNWNHRDARSLVISQPDSYPIMAYDEISYMLDSDPSVSERNRRIALASFYFNFMAYSLSHEFSSIPEEIRSWAEKYTLISIRLRRDYSLDAPHEREAVISLLLTGEGVSWNDPSVTIPYHTFYDRIQ